MADSQPSPVAVGHRYAPDVPAVRSDVPPDHPVPPTGPGRPWTWSVSDIPITRLPMVLHRAHRALPVEAAVDVEVRSPDGADRVGGLLTGAGFAVPPGVTAGADGTVRAQVVRRNTLADTVGPGMRLLVCGVNPSPYSADAGIGYARPGNRFWPAALAAGVVGVDRDPVAAFEGGLGMTDFAKRPTRTAAEVQRDEYEAGFARVSGLVEWLRPGAVCFIGLSGWRTVVDKHAVAGPQPGRVGGRPAYVVPSTSGLNARTSLAALAGHLAAAWKLAGTAD
jgi:TDG/mug DNA glycosylase family protein